MQNYYYLCTRVQLYRMNGQKNRDKNVPTEEHNK